MGLDVNSRLAAPNLLKLVRYSYELDNTPKHTGELKKNQPLTRPWTSIANIPDAKTGKLSRSLMWLAR
jgi:hypothetical protein